ncbi:MAG TPA: ABC transporter permease [Vicinamibacterales bacterium]|nr:ABC transporter permease [Vicinamibacterales bacterium]
MTGDPRPAGRPVAPRSIPEGVEAELRFHLDTRTEELIARGLAPDAARAQAHREFGDLDDARRFMHETDERAETSARRRAYMREFVQDLKYGWRRLVAAPAFSATAILTLALGIGANTAIFSMVYGVLVRPLPFPEPDRLYTVYSANRSANMLHASVSPVDLDDWRGQRNVIDDIGGYWYSDGSSGVDLSGRGDPRRLAAVFITPGLLSTLGVQPVAGRLPREDELVRGGPDKIALLTYGFWQREFGGAPDAIGAAIALDGDPYSIIGVLPESLRYPTEQADLFLPYSTIPDTSIPRLRFVRLLTVVARARPGVTRENVSTEMQAITARLAAQYPQENQAWGAATVEPLAEVISGPVQDPLLVLLGAVGLVLLMACVNVTGLQLARSATRVREVAVRLALGARRERLVRQLLTESLLLAGFGGAIGLGLADVGLRGLLLLSAGELPRSGEIALDLTVVLFALAVTIVTGVLVGLVPAWRMSRGGHAQLALRHGGRSVAGSGHGRLQRGLVVAEVAFAMMLAVGAGLMARSFLALTRVDPGFKADQLIAVQFTIDTARHSPPPPAVPPPANVPQPPVWTAYYQEVIEKVRTLPGVISAAAVKDAPFRGNGERNGFTIPGQPVPAGQDSPTATVIHVSDGYFRTIGARVDGREYTPRDRFGAPFVVIVNDAFARQYFPGERAVGKRVQFGPRGDAEIIGVVDDIRQVAVSEPARPTIYIHNLQNGRVKTTIVARVAGDPLSLVPAIRNAIWSIDPAQPIAAAFTFDDAVSHALARPRLLTVLLGAFAVLGLLLGAVGLYGVLAALVSERRREIGVRLALGARPADVLSMIVRGGLALTVVGVVIGLAAAFGLSGFLASVLYGVAPTDLTTFAGTAIVLIATAAVASWLPARRAAGVDPVETLRAD